MQSKISKELNMKFPPIALLKSDTKPEDAKGPKQGRGGCVMSFIAQTIAKRTTTCFGTLPMKTCNGFPGNIPVMRFWNQHRTREHT